MGRYFGKSVMSLRWSVRNGDCDLASVCEFDGVAYQIG